MADAPAALGNEHLLPWERGKDLNEDEAAQSLFDLLGSDFDDEQPSEADGPPPAEAGGAEDDDEDADKAPPAEASESEDDDSEEDALEATPPSLHKLKANGQEEEITYEELLRRAAAGTDYTRKSQAAAEERKQLTAKAAEIATAREQYAARLEIVEDFLRDSAPQEPDWDKLRKENPGEYLLQRDAQDRRKQQLDAVKAERARVQAEQAGAAEDERSAMLAEESLKLHTAVPEWKDPKVAGEAMKEMVEYLEGKWGYSRQEIEAVGDHRLLLIVRDALLWQKHQQKAPEVKEKIREKVKAAEVVRPGARTPSTPTSKAKAELKRAKQKLARSGSVADAAALLMGMPDTL